MIQQSPWTYTEENYYIIHHKVHCSTVYQSQDTETTQVFINRGIDKEDVVHIYNEMLVGYKEE